MSTCFRKKNLKKKEENKKINYIISNPKLCNSPKNINDNILKNIQIKEKLSLGKNSFNRFFEKKINKEIKENCKKTAEKELVDFMINEETKFANFNQIENYFKEDIVNNNKIFDANKIYIEKKQMEIECLNLMIEKELIHNLDYDYDNIVKKYEEEKNQLLLEIGLKEDDLITFERIKNSLIENKVNQFRSLFCSFVLQIKTC